jgi:hypothetical protein
MASLLVDLVCLVLLCGYLALEMLAGHYHIAEEFIFEHVNALWATYCALVFFFYALVQLRSFPPTVGRYFGFLGRLFLLLALAAAFGTLFDIWLRPIDRGEWPLATWGIFIPPIPAAFIAFTLAFGFRLLRRRAI